MLTHQPPDVRWTSRPVADRTRRAESPSYDVLLFTGCLLCGIFCGCAKEPPETAKSQSGHERMVALLADIRDRTPEEHPSLGVAQWKQAERTLAELPVSNIESRFHTRWILAYHMARGGEIEKSIAHFETAFADYPKIRSKLNPEERERFLTHLAAACLRLGETENCVNCQTGESCILPLKGGGIHTRRTGMEKAQRYLNVLLEENPDHLTARWLLNIAAMALDNYPDGVPEKFRVSPEKFQSKVDFPRFTNIARELGVDAFNTCGGTVVDDFDNDGYLDILTSTWDPKGEIVLFKNRGDGTFEKRIDKAGLKGIFGGLNMVQADYDNDGAVDVLVLRGAWLGDAGGHPNSLLKNDGTGYFRDVTFEAGLGRRHFPTQTAAWGDYNNDGHLDLYIGNEDHPCQLFANNGKGRFIDIAGEAGVENNGFTKGVVWGDFDNDRFPDLYVSNLYGPNRLYRNNQNGTFTDVAPLLAVTGPEKSFPVWFWDYNNDGVLDLYVSSWWPDVKYVAATFLDVPHEAERACLYEGDGDGGFRDVAVERGLTANSQPMGANFGDLDNDGWLDFYLGTGYPEYEGLMPNLMYRNAEGTRFDDVTMAGGFGHLQKGHGVAFADLNNDGSQDLYIQMGGAYAGDEFRNLLFENPGFPNHWIGIQLIGTTTNRSAIGARICVNFEEDGQIRRIYKWVNSGGSFGANPLAQQIGLGKGTSIKSIEIDWPATGKTQVVSDLEADQFVEITEGQPESRPRRLKSFSFKRSKVEP